MNLLSLFTGWDGMAPATERYSPLDDDLDCEVLIIGGGILGALTANELHNQGTEVAVVDSREASLGNPGFTEMPFGFSEMGFPHAGDINSLTKYQLFRESRNKAEAFIHEMDIDCKFRKIDLLKVCRDTEGMEELAREFVTLEECGRTVEWLTSDALAREYLMSTAHGGLRNPQGACMDVLAFTHGLLANLQRSGVAVHDRTTLKECTSAGGGYEFKSTGGHAVSCREVVFANSAKACSLCRDVETHIVKKSVVITEPLTDKVAPWLQGAMLTHQPPISLSLWMTSDRRLVIERKENRDAKNWFADSEVAARLCKEAQEWLPDLKLTPEFVSRTNAIQTDDGLPLAGSVPGMPGVYTAIGTDAYPLEGSMIASEILVSSITGVYHPAVEHFRFPTDTPYPDSLASV